MKKVTGLLLIGAISFSCNKLRDYFPLPESPQINKIYGGSNGEGALRLIQSVDGGYVFTGSSESNDGDATGNHGITDAWVVKLDNEGKKMWQRMLGGSSVDHGQAIARTPDGGYILAAVTTSNDGDINGQYHGGVGEDAWIVKLDKEGNTEWHKTFGGTASDIPSSIIATADGDYIMTGYTESNDGDLNDGHRTQYDAWIVKLNAQGLILWQQTLGGSDLDYAHSIIPTLDGGYIMVGNTLSKDAHIPGYHSRGDVWIVKLDGNGNIAWQRAYGGWNYETAAAIVATADSSYIVAATTTSQNGDVKKNHGQTDAWIIKIDSKGKLLWEKSFGGSRADVALALTVTQNGGYAFAGYTGSNDGDVSGLHGKEYNDAWVVKLDANGNMLWQQTRGGTNEDEAHSIITRSNGDYVIAGGSLSNDGDVPGSYGQSDAWVFTAKVK